MATLHDTAVGQDANSATSLNAADTLAVTAGDLIYVIFRHEGNAFTAGDIPDGSECTDGTNTYAIGNAYYTSTQTNSSGQLHAVTFYATAASSGNITVNVTLPSARTYRHLKAYSFTPAANKTLQKGNVAAAQGIGSSNPNAGSASATAAGASVCSYAIYDTPTITAGTGWSVATEFNTASDLCTQYRLQTGAGTLTGDCTASGSLNDWLAQMTIFNEADATTSVVAQAMHYYRMQRN